MAGEYKKVSKEAGRYVVRELRISDEEKKLSTIINSK